MPPPLVTALAALALLAGCSEETGNGQPDRSAARAAERPAAVPAAPGEVANRFPALVLDDGDGAELCVGTVAESLPPQCGGPPLSGWDWAEHEGDYEETGGVRYGEFLVTGTFDGTSITPTRVVPGDQMQPPAPSPQEDLFATPCPEPVGGWRVLDPGRTTEIGMDRAFQVAAGLDDYADAWQDQSINPAWNGGNPASEAEAEMLNDPTLLIINVRVTRDPEAAERALRAVWGGALCVSIARHTPQELLDITDDLMTLPGSLAGTPGRDAVDFQVLYDDGSYQAWADATYGEGTVRVTSALVGVG